MITTSAAYFMVGANAPRGTVIATLASTGRSPTFSVRDPSGLFSISGANLITNWVAPAASGIYPITVQAAGRGYLETIALTMTVAASPTAPAPAPAPAPPPPPPPPPPPAPGTPSIAVNGSGGPVTVVASSALTIVVSGGPANKLDWVAIYATSGGAYLDWRYLADDSDLYPPAGVSSGTVHLTAPNMPGQYEARFLLNDGFKVAAVSAPIMVQAAAPAPPPPPTPTPIGVIVSHDLYNAGKTDAMAKPYSFGQGFRMGDVPAGSYPTVADSNGNPLVSQIDEISRPYPDNSMRHCVISTIVTAAVASGSAYRLQIRRASGVYSPGTPPRSIGDIKVGHAFQVKYQGVVNSSHTTVGSGNWTFDVNAAINAGHYEITANGPVRLGATVYGFFTDDTGGAASPWLYCQVYFEVYSDPANLANVLYIEYLPFLSQPFIDVPNPDAMLGRAIMMDGATVIRDLGADSFSVGPSAIVGGITPSVDTSSSPLVIQENQVFKLSLQAGAGNALPSGLAAGDLVFLNVQRPGVPALMAKDPAELVPVTITNTGTAGGGTPTPFIFSNRQMLPHYQGFYICADYNGTPLRTGAVGVDWADFEICLDGVDHGVAQKAYWQSTGIFLGYDLTLGASLQPIDFNFPIFALTYTGVHYVPGTNGLYKQPISGGSEDWYTGPGSEWDARCFARLGVSNWTRQENQFWRCCALQATNLPFTQMYRSAFPRRVVVANNGPTNFTSPPFHSGTGASYPGLGPPDPNMYVISATQFNNFNMPANAVNSSIFPYGEWAHVPFRPGSTSALTADHWPIAMIWQYALFGKRYFLDQLRLQAAHNLICCKGGGDGVHISTGDWVAPYPGAAGGQLTFWSKIPVSGQERDDMGTMTTVAASHLGAQTDPDVAYLYDQFMSWLHFWDFWYNIYMNQGNDDINPGIKTAGWWMWARQAEPWMMSGYGGIAYAFMRNVSRHPLAQTPCNAQATLAGVLWDEVAGIPLFFVPAYNYQYGTAGFVPFAPPGDHGLGSLPYPTSKVLAPNYNGFSLDTTGLWTLVIGGGGPGNSRMPLKADALTFALANGDEVRMADLLQTSEVYTGPTGYDANTTYYACQVNVGAKTFRLTPMVNDPTGTAAVTATSSVPTDGSFLQMRCLSYNPPPGGPDCGGMNTFQHSSYSYYSGAMHELDRGGVTPSNPAVNWSRGLAKMDAWGGLTDFRPIITNSSTAFRWKIVSTYPIQ